MRVQLTLTSGKRQTVRPNIKKNTSLNLCLQDDLRRIPNKFNSFKLHPK